MTQVQLSRTIAAPISQLYRAFTNSTALREWLSDFATTDHHPGGRLYLWWNSGYYTAGAFTDLVPNERVEFSWFGRGEPGQTTVRVDLKEQEGKTAVTLTHSGLGSGPEWEAERAKFEKEWERSLRYLAAALETGEDLRITRRPMLGIILGEFNETIAARIGCPVTEGVALDDLVEGMGAKKAGLQQGDVIVSLDGKKADTYSEFTHIIQGHEAGDQLEVGFYRGPEKRTVMMTLSARPIPEIPWNAEELARRVEQITEPAMRELAAAFEGYSDEEASKPPAPGEWSAKQVLAHLIHGERGLNEYMSQVVTGAEALYDDFGSNSHPRANATVKVFGTLQGLLDELSCLSRENVEFFRTLPDEFLQNKPSYWRLAYGVLQDPYHTNTHLEQIRSALQAARG